MNTYVIYLDGIPVYKVVNTVADAITMNNRRGYHASVVYINLAEDRLADNTFSPDTTKIIQHSMAYIDLRTWSHSLNPNNIIIVLKPADIGLESEYAQSVCNEIWDYIAYNASYLLSMGCDVDNALRIECDSNVLADFFLAASGCPLDVANV